MPASRGTLPDPQGKESPASRIQRCPEVQLNGATQQLAFLSTGFSKYLIAVRYLVLHMRACAHTHTETGRIAQFYHHDSYCLQTTTSGYIPLQLEEGRTVFKMLLRRNVGANLWMRFRKHAEEFSVNKVGSLFSPTDVGKLKKRKKKVQRNNSSSYFCCCCSKLRGLIEASMNALLVELE